MQLRRLACNRDPLRREMWADLELCGWAKGRFSPANGSFCRGLPLRRALLPNSQRSVPKNSSHDSKSCSAVNLAIFDAAPLPRIANCRRRSGAISQWTLANSGPSSRVGRNRQTSLSDQGHHRPLDRLAQRRPSGDDQRCVGPQSSLSACSEPLPPCFIPAPS